MSYCVNEIIKYILDEVYYEFGMKNVFDNLLFIYGCEIIFLIFLEFIVVIKEMLLRMEIEDL